MITSYPLYTLFLGKKRKKIIAENYLTKANENVFGRWYSSFLQKWNELPTQGAKETQEINCTYPSVPERWNLQDERGSLLRDIKNKKRPLEEGPPTDPVTKGFVQPVQLPASHATACFACLERPLPNKPVYHLSINFIQVLRTQAKITHILRQNLTLMILRLVLNSIIIFQSMKEWPIKLYRKHSMVFLAQSSKLSHVSPIKQFQCP